MKKKDTYEGGKRSTLFDAIFAPSDVRNIPSETPRAIMAREDPQFFVELPSK